MIKIGTMIGDRYEVLERIGWAECQMFIRQRITN